MTPTVAILCGGRGTRLQTHAQALPKPLVEIGGKPILWHVVQIYLAHGFDTFLLLTGHRAGAVAGFVDSAQWPAGVRIDCLDTGADTPTGGRIHRARARLSGGTFCLTYADGVADIDLRALLAEHSASGATATMTIVRPELPFGVADVTDSGLVRGFVEKPRSDHWINGGFFCMEPGVFSALSDDATLERAPLEALAAGGRLRAHRHDGFWACVDTYKDQVRLNDLCDAGDPPWKLWI